MTEGVARFLTGFRIGSRRLLARTCALAAVFCAWNAGAQAQTIEEYTAMSCGQFVALPLETQLGVLFWLDGYESRTDQDPVLDFSAMARDIRDMEDQCASQARLTVGQMVGVRL